MKLKLAFHLIVLLNYIDFMNNFFDPFCPFRDLMARMSFYHLFSPFQSIRKQNVKTKCHFWLLVMLVNLMFSSHLESIFNDYILSLPLFIKMCLSFVFPSLNNVCKTCNVRTSTSSSRKDTF